MAEFINRELRVNEAVDQLTKLLEESRKRVPTAISSRSYTTLPDGRVLDRFGKVIYDPKAGNEARKT